MSLRERLALDAGSLNKHSYLIQNTSTSSRRFSWTLAETLVTSEQTLLILSGYCSRDKKICNMKIWKQTDSVFVRSPSGRSKPFGFLSSAEHKSRKPEELLWSWKRLIPNVISGKKPSNSLVLCAKEDGKSACVYDCCQSSSLSFRWNIVATSESERGD